jgi:hypothetical protein
MSDEILVGVVSGLLATGIFSFTLFFVSVLWRKQIEPWWENKLYQDARIDGEWVTELEAQQTDKDVEVASINQVGHSICGNITCTQGPDEGRKYKFKGTFRNQILTGYYWNTKKTSIDSGSFSLRLENDGERLKGYTSYYHDDSHNIISRKYTWVRRVNEQRPNDSIQPTADASTD